MEILSGLILKLFYYFQKDELQRKIKETDNIMKELLVFMITPMNVLQVMAMCNNEEHYNSGIHLSYFFVFFHIITMLYQSFIHVYLALSLKSFVTVLDEPRVLSKTQTLKLVYTKPFLECRICPVQTCSVYTVSKYILDLG